MSPDRTRCVYPPISIDGHPTRRWRRTAAPPLRSKRGGNSGVPLTLDLAFPAAVAQLCVGPQNYELYATTTVLLRGRDWNLRRVPGWLSILLFHLWVDWEVYLPAISLALKLAEYACPAILSEEAAELARRIRLANQLFHFTRRMDRAGRDCRSQRSRRPAITAKPNQRIEPMRRSAFRLVSHSGAIDALLLMAHPGR